MKTILAFDTSSSNLTVALEYKQQLFCHTAQYGLHHSEHLLPSIERVLDQAGCTLQEIELIGVSRGPGSFTGLRISMATAKGLSFGLGIPVVSIPTLEIYQHQFSWFERTVMPIIDARKQRWYTGIFQEGTLVGDVLDIPAEQLILQASEHRPVLITGPDAAAFQRECIAKSLPIEEGIYFHVEETHPTGRSLIASAVRSYARFGADHATAGPLYTRKSEAEELLSAHRKTL